MNKCLYPSVLIASNLVIKQLCCRMAAVSGCSTLEYVTKNESVVLIHDSLESSTTSVNTELVMEPASLNGKRKSSSKSESSGGSSPKASRLQQSPPLLPKAKRSGRQHLVFPHSWNPSAGKLERCQEKEERSNMLHQTLFFMELRLRRLY